MRTEWRFLSIFHLWGILLLSGSAVMALAQEKKPAAAMALPSPAPLLSAAICGEGKLLLSASGQPLGNETFQVVCKPDGYSASGHTELKIPGQAVDFTTTIDLDKRAVPTKFSIKGTAGGSPIEQTITFGDGTATIASGGNTQTLSYTKGASFSGSNILYLFVLIAARYDAAAGGEQTVPLFPNLTATIARPARDVIQPPGLDATARPSGFDRYRLQIGPTELILWADKDGRVVMICQPGQRFVAVREESAHLTGPLLDALSKSGVIREPDYSAPPDAPFTAEEVEISRPGFKLAGTLLLPKKGKGPFPAVVTSTGSGQQTRDEPIGPPGRERFRPFRQIAEALAANGIAVFRVDDRGVGRSTGIASLEKATTYDFADDVAAQVAYLRSRKEINPGRIAVLGHSEGGAIAPLVASADRKLRAIVLLAGPGKRGDEILLYQLNLQADEDKSLSDEQRKRKHEENAAMIKAAKEGGDLSKLPPLLRFEWTRAFLNHDPLPTIRQVRQPVLILQGEDDKQVTADQAGILASAARAAGNREVTVRVFPGLSHFFLPSDVKPLEASDKSDPLLMPAEVVNAITEWLRVKLKR